MAEEYGPLQGLARRLLSMASPPSLSILLSLMGDAESYQDFVSLVREVLPEREDDILRNTSPELQMAAFAQYFEEGHFPLWPMFQDGEVEEYAELTRGIPMVLMSLSYDTYHELAESDCYRSGMQLMSYLLEDPSAPAPAEAIRMSPEERSGGRIALAEACSNLVPESLIHRVCTGLSEAEAHRLLDGTRFQAVAHWADMLAYETGNFFFDTDEESYGSYELVEWSRENVEHYTREWLRAQAIDAAVTSLCDWLEEDLPSHFLEIIEFIERRQHDLNHGAEGAAVGSAPCP